MSPAKGRFRSAALAACLAIGTMTAACAARVGVGYRVYDPGHRDYHRWDDRETVFYNQWAVETHRDPHREFRRLNRDDQREYWTWRHGHDDKR